jgi:hypothetical protein
MTDGVGLRWFWLIPAFSVVWLIFGSYFLVSEDREPIRKRRLYRVFETAPVVLFPVVPLLMGMPALPSLIMWAVLAAFHAVIPPRMRFCNTCGRSELRLGFTDVKVCSRCGSAIK